MTFVVRPRSRRSSEPELSGSATRSFRRHRTSRECCYIESSDIQSTDLYCRNKVPPRPMFTTDQE